MQQTEKSTEEEEILAAITQEQPIQQALDKDYWLQLDLPVPLLIVFHQPEAALEVSSLVRGETSYLIVPARPDASDQAQIYIDELMKARAGKYGSFLLLDILFDASSSTDLQISYFQEKSQATVKALKEALSPFKTLYNTLTVSSHEVTKPTLPNLKLLKQTGSIWIQIRLPSMFARPQQEESYPVLLRNFRDLFSEALRQASYTFLRVQTTYEVTHPRTLGRTTVDDAFWEADKQLYEIERSFEFLMLVSAINLNSAWKKFKEEGYQKMPTFYYPILPVDPEERKHALYQVRIDDVHDPTLAFLLRDKRRELDKQLDMLRERGTEDFLYSSLRLYKSIDEKLLSLANMLLKEIPVEKTQKGTFSARQFASRVEEEFAYFQQQNPDFKSKIHLKSSIPGLMVSRGELYIPSKMILRDHRVDALIQHEVGTHVLTYYNGSQQPIQLLRLGLADYDELQEGLAVLSEYLTGGMDPLRMRLLAARVVVAYERMNHTPFRDTFALLTEKHKFHPRTAFNTVARIYQSGGFTKDLIYLRGFFKVLQHLRKGGSLEPLLMGKIAVKHIEVIQALRERGILHPPAIRPRYWFDDAAQQRLAELRKKNNVNDIVSEIAS
uniref:DUF1704 domain-containing protein n=1 Tax=Roseihalotalea indica TaxID=2867963 RepID=A0AA49GQ32_9BACT|nr:DUF1704 domain-containing protein [Tunicatimonas sp. TK19036]